MIEAVASLPPLDSIAGLSLADMTTPGATPVAKSGFEQLLQHLEQSEIKTGQVLSDMATGQADQLHHVMLQMETTRMQFELLLQMRNKLLEAYQDVMRMQI